MVMMRVFSIFRLLAFILFLVNLFSFFGIGESETGRVGDVSDSPIRRFSDSVSKWRTTYETSLICTIRVLYPGVHPLDYCQ